jgi:hypothetical protein
VVKLEEANKMSCAPNENVIIQISDKVKSSDEYKKEVMLMSENKMRKNSNLFEFYECLTIYEAFIGAAIKHLEPVENNEQIKKIHDRINTLKEKLDDYNDIILETLYFNMTNSKQKSNWHWTIVSKIKILRASLLMLSRARLK